MKQWILIILVLVLLSSCATRRKVQRTEQTKIEVAQTGTTHKDFVKKDSTITATETDVVTVQTTERMDTIGRVTERTTTTTVKKTKTNRHNGQTVTATAESKTTTTAKQQTEKKETNEQKRSPRFFYEVIIFIFILLVLFAISLYQLIKIQRR